MEDKNFKDKIFMGGQKTVKSAKIFSLKNLGYTVLATYIPSCFEKMFSKILDYFGIFEN